MLEIVRRTATVLFLLFVFLVGVRALGDGFKLLGAGVLESFFLATANPFVGLMVGILATTLVQSSSVTTSMVVGLVAAPENPLPVMNAIPMIMGANIGTTVTNTIVSWLTLVTRESSSGPTRWRLVMTSSTSWPSSSCCLWSSRRGFSAR